MKLEMEQKCRRCSTPSSGKRMIQGIILFFWNGLSEVDSLLAKTGDNSTAFSSPDRSSQSGSTLMRGLPLTFG